MNKQQQIDRNKAMSQDAKSGLTYTDLAKKYNQSYANVVRIMRLAKEEKATETKSTPRYNNLEIFEMHEAGVDIPTILRTYEISKHRLDMIIEDGIAGLENEPVKHFTRFTWPKPVVPSEPAAEEDIMYFDGVVKKIKETLTFSPIDDQQEKQLIELVKLWRMRSKIDEQIFPGGRDV